MVNLNKQYKPWFGLLTYVIAIGALLAGQVAASVVVYTIGMMGIQNETLTTALSLIFQATNLIVFLVILRKTKAKPAVYLKMRRPAVGCAFGAGFGIISLFCFLPLATAGQLLLDKIGYNFAGGYVRGILAQDVIMLFLTVIAAPVCEELIFRSSLISGLKNSEQGMRDGRRGIFNDIAASLLCGLAFSLMHMNPEQTVYQFCLGFGASMLALSTGSVIPAIIMHAVSNLIAALDIIGVGAIGHFFAWYERTFFSSNALFAITTVLFTLVGAAVFVFVPLIIKRKLGVSADLDKPLSDGTTAEGTTAYGTMAEGTTANETDPFSADSWANAQGSSRSAFEGSYGFSDSMGQSQKKSGGRRMWMYYVGIGVCAFMWLTVFAAGFISLP